MSENNLDFSVIPLSCLQNHSQNVLSMLLNPCKTFLTDDNIPRDWRGLAQLAEIPSEIIPSFMTSQDPTACVLSYWSQKSVQNANLHKLHQFLQRMDRFDVFDDTKSLLESDAQDYLHKSQASAPTASPSSSSLSYENDVLTIQDQYLFQQGVSSPQYYDGLVLFADEDVIFAKELIIRMENYGLKLCVKDRDLLGGLSSEHSTMLRLIAERCHRLIAIITPAFLQSPSNGFLIDFAQALGIEEKKRKIVPCLYKSCELPHQLSFYFHLNYQRAGILFDFWEKLHASIKSTPAIIPRNQRATIREMESDLQSISMLPSPPRLAISNIPSSYSHRNIVQPPTPIIQINGNISDSFPEPSLPAYSAPINHARSMVNLNSNTHVIDEQSLSVSQNSGMLVSMSNISDIVNGDTVKSERIKKSPWYLNFFKSNVSSKNLKDLDYSNESIKQKKKWHLKKAKKRTPVLAD